MQWSFEVIMSVLICGELIIIVKFYNLINCEIREKNAYFYPIKLQKPFFKYV